MELGKKTWVFADGDLPPQGEEGYQIPKGQYAVILTSNVPVVAAFGRLDRRKDMAYYPVAGYSI